MRIDWSEVYAVEPTFYDRCWEESDSYCCRTNSPHLSFKFMRHDAAGMIYIHSEWDYCKGLGRIQEGFEEIARKIEFPIRHGRTIRLVSTYCSLKGLCTFPEYRPLICRFYPFFPRVSVEQRRITGYVLGSAVDQYWDLLGLEHPCFLRRKQESLCLEGLHRLEPLLKNPAILFYFKAIEIVADRLRDDFKQKYSQLLSLPPKQFFQRWELIYLTGKAFDKEGLKQDLASLDEKVARLYGDFEL